MPVTTSFGVKPTVPTTHLRTTTGWARRLDRITTTFGERTSASLQAAAAVWTEHRCPNRPAAHYFALCCGFSEFGFTIKPSSRWDERFISLLLWISHELLLHWKTYCSQSS